MGRSGTCPTAEGLEVTGDLTELTPFLVSRRLEPIGSKGQVGDLSYSQAEACATQNAGRGLFGVGG
jgi:hypothetical protein